MQTEHQKCYDLTVQQQWNDSLNSYVVKLVSSTVGDDATAVDAQTEDDLSFLALDENNFIAPEVISIVGDLKKHCGVNYGSYERPGYLSFVGYSPSTAKLSRTVVDNAQVFKYVISWTEYTPDPIPDGVPAIRSLEEFVNLFDSYYSLKQQIANKLGFDEYGIFQVLWQGEWIDYSRLEDLVNEPEKESVSKINVGVKLYGINDSEVIIDDIFEFPFKLEDWNSWLKSAQGNVKMEQERISYEHYYVKDENDEWLGVIMTNDCDYKFAPYDDDDEDAIKVAIADLTEQPEGWYPPSDITVNGHTYTLEEKSDWEFI